MATEPKRVGLGGRPAAAVAYSLADEDDAEMPDIMREKFPEGASGFGVFCKIFDYIFFLAKVGNGLL